MTELDCNGVVIELGDHVTCGVDEEERTGFVTAIRPALYEPITVTYDVVPIDDDGAAYDTEGDYASDEIEVDHPTPKET